MCKILYISDYTKMSKTISNLYFLFLIVGECIYNYVPADQCYSNNGEDCGSGVRELLGTLQSGSDDCADQDTIYEQCHLPSCGNYSKLNQ